MKRKNLIANLIIVLAFAGTYHSCVDQIEFELPVGYDDSIVVQGKLSKSEINFIDVQISQLFNNDASTDIFHFNRVLLQDDEGNEIEVPFRGTQLYHTVLGTEFPLAYGTSYKIRLELRNGKVIESTYSELKELPRQNELSYKIDPRIEISEHGEEQEKKYVQYYLNTKLSKDVTTKYHHDIQRTYKFTDYSRPKPLQENFLRIPPLSFKRHVCYITDRRDVEDTKLIDPIVINNFIDVEGNYESMIFEERLDYKYAEDYFFTVVQESISQDVYEYYDKIRQILSFSGGMFEPKPAAVKSNMKFLEDTEASVFGYFYATEQDTTRIQVDRLSVGKPDTICLSPGGGFSSGEVLSPQTSCRWKVYACCDCLNEEDSTLEEPHYWSN